ncbi:MAG: KGG domain-containing protein [Tepidisphaeraceae bacterium]
MEHRTRASGFASMDQSKQREIARKGGTAAHKKGTAHEFTTEEARDAGKKGGQQVSANRSHMIEIGRLGGRRSAESRRNRESVAHRQGPVEVTVSPAVRADQKEEPTMRPQ